MGQCSGGDDTLRGENYKEVKGQTGALSETTPKRLSSIAARVVVGLPSVLQHAVEECRQ